VKLVSLGRWDGSARLSGALSAAVDQVTSKAGGPVGGASSGRKRQCTDDLRRCEHVFVPELRYSVTECDPQRPWVMVTRTRGLVVDIDADDFPAWAASAWPAPRYKTELEPGALRPWQEQ
jgi:hypothetical protein